MHYIKLLTVLSLALSLMTISKPLHANDIYACDYNCNDVERYARIMSMPYWDGDELSVIDLKSGLAYTYTAMKTFNYFGELVETVNRTARSPEASLASSQYLNLRANQGVIPLQIPVNYAPITNFRNVTSSIDLISNPQVADWVGTYLTTTQSMRNKLTNYVNDIASLGIRVAVGSTLESNVLVQFDNGSTALFSTRYTWENGVTIQDLQYVEGSARFADGSLVPRNAGQIIGNWRFEHAADLQGFIRLGALWGVSFSDDRGGADSNCVPEETECRILPDDTYSCDISYVCE